MISIDPDNAGGIATNSGVRPNRHRHAFVDEQDQAEGRQHLLQVIAIIEFADDQEFDDQPGNARSNKSGRYRSRRNEPVRAATSAAA